MRCEGTFQGRPIAKITPLATREVSILQESDDHPNVVRYFYYDQELDFNDLCPGSLAGVFENLESDVEDKMRENWKDIAQGFDERKAMKQIASELRHLHEFGIDSSGYQISKYSDIVLFQGTTLSNAHLRLWPMQKTRHS